MELKNDDYFLCCVDLDKFSSLLSCCVDLDKFSSLLSCCSFFVSHVSMREDELPMILCHTGVSNNPRCQFIWPITFLKGRSTCRCVTCLPIHEL
jgi:hypothetical protein